MTRRTDWGEYAYPSAPESRGRGGTGGSAAEGFGPYDDGASYGMPGPYDGEPHDAEPYGDGGDVGLPYDGARAGGGAPGGARRRGGVAGRGAGGDERGRRGRGGRRRGFGEPADGPEDGGTQNEGSSLSSRAERAESSGDPAERARAICLHLLTGTPRTRKQLADALHKREIPDDVADEVLSRFEEVGLINDSAFADAWVESRHHGRGLARRALARELRTKGVDSALIDEAVAQLDSEQEEATARELVARKLRSTRGLDRDKRLRRLAGMLARKGYPEGMALRVVRQALEEEGEDTEGLEDEGY
ncbi:recombination regulator RecX [Streptomyces tailanensis]|uniref:recombination regulator RecX n=1 Tax=Streptomyces tailanensis TaxID=2569858 RepID=UPI00122E5E02|nr:recombination regulator RecX [Streptomyces tailanensis]